MMPHLQQGYDVFLSFRGEDTRMGFTGHLYDALIRNDITTYKDDRELEIGKPIASELLQAIETSRIAVVVLSANFATSRWCLEEIAKIVDCMKQGKLILIPVFYHVSPSDVRHQSNSFVQGFANHAANPLIAPQKVEAWRDAFKKVGAVSGLHVTDYSVEAEVVRNIVSKVLKNLPDTMSVDLSNSLVGIKSRVDEVKRMLRMESSEVLFVGICGMSGIGKTTLAEAVYKDIKNEFDKSSLIENIKEITKQDDSTNLCKFQQKLLDDLLKEKSTRVENVSHGQTLLGTKLRGLKAIIILDDVNHVDQLTYLARGLEWFGPGSKIIVTTTNRDLLMSHKINDVYWCEEMKADEALCLFSQSAFEQSHPTHGYEMFSKDIVKLAGGLPLALKVYGNQLRGKDENYWIEMLEMLKEYPEEEVLGRLEVVYARLNENQRYVFIYIACFLKGRNKDLVKDILRNIGLYSERGITDLINKSLITINLDDSVWMHDLLQQMCWKIIRTESQRYDGKHIAIKSCKDTLTLNYQGARTVEVVNQDPYKSEVRDCFIDSKCFSKMTNLKFLRIRNVQFLKELKHLSNDLRIIEWYGCTLQYLPSKFEPKSIYELEMCSSQLKTLWKKDLELPNLRSINLSFSMNLTGIPNLRSTPNLGKLKLEGCTSLTSLHESVLLHKHIYYLNLKGCTCLQSLGRSRMEMEALEALILSGCSKIEYIPEFGKNMKRLEHLYVDGTRIKKLPENLGEMCNLRKIDASRTNIEELPSSIYRLKKLRQLHVSKCMLSFKTGCFLNPGLHTLSSCLKEVDISYCNVSVVPDGIGLLCHLITLDLSGNEFVSLPASIDLLSKLRMLSLNNCKRLRSLPKLSLIDEDMDYGPRSRFNYYVSAKEVDVSKFSALSFNNRPTVLCLNCSKLALDKRGSFLSEKILNNYLELRSREYWMTPEAVFQIVGDGNEIPLGFEDPGYGGLPLIGPWIGVAICAVISTYNVDGFMKANYMVTARIRFGTKYIKIPIPINFLVEGSETQIIIYWTIPDDPQRIAFSRDWGIFNVSFDLEPDSDLHVTKVGIRFIREEYMRLKQFDEDTKIKGTNTIEVINQEPYNGEVNDHFIDHPTCFSNLKKLKFLRNSNVHFPEGPSYLSNVLRILEWHGCSLKSFPSMFEPKHIYEVELCFSQLKTIWTKDIELPKLRSINLSFSKDLPDIPNLTTTLNLVNLNLEGCMSLASLHESVLLHKRLCYLNLKGCTCLQSFGRGCMEMEALEALVLSGCSELENIPEFGKNMKHLEHLYVDGTRIQKLPENLGVMCNLRILDASGTIIEELPSSIHRLEKLRQLHVGNCLLSFKTGCFLYPGLHTLSSCLKEVDLSYCNLSVVPDGIGLLCHLITLDLSGNEFVSLPASIGLLSKLRTLCLNNCKRLQSLPKLSLVDEDMDYGPRSRFNYYVSAEGVDVSKFNALNFNNHPIVLCLNCSKLAVDKRGSNLAEKILNSYLELRSMKYWMAPEAIFQIVGAGSEISPVFVETDHRGLILQGPWIGIAICAVISVCHVDGYMGAAHMVTAHIRLGGKHLKVPVPINFLVAGSETQVILYWTIPDDPQRIAAGSIQWGIFDVSFDMEPDSNLLVTKVGFRFICEEYFMSLKRPEDKIKVGEGIHKDISLRYERYMNACSKDDPNLQHHTPNIVNFILDYASQHNNNSLVGISQVTKGLFEINQEFLRILDLREWWGEEFVYCYYVISLGVSVLYKDFVRSVRDKNDGWLSVKLALEQILVKSKADNYSYEEMKLHLNDLEAIHSVEFSDNFITMFLCICRRTFDFLFSITKQLSDNLQEEKMFPEDVLPGILWKDVSLGVLRKDVMLRKDALPRKLRKDVLPRMLQEDVLPRMLREDVLPRMLRDDVLPRIIREDVLPRMLREDVLPRVHREIVLMRRLRGNDLGRMLREDVLNLMLHKYKLPRMLLEELAKISSIQIAGVICMMVVSKLQKYQETKHTPLHSLWQHMFKACADVKDRFTEDGWFKVKTHYNRELQISDFDNNRVLLQQLLNKMSRSDCFTKENAEELKSVTDKLQDNINKVSSTIQEMSSHADQYCHDIEEAKKRVELFSQLLKDDNIISMLPLFNRN